VETCWRSLDLDQRGRPFDLFRSVETSSDKWMLVFHRTSGSRLCSLQCSRLKLSGHSSVFFSGYHANLDKLNRLLKLTYYEHILVNEEFCQIINSLLITRSLIWQVSLTSYRLGVGGGGWDNMPPLTAVWLAADLRLSAHGSAVRTSLVAGQLQAASVPIA